MGKMNKFLHYLGLAGEEMPSRDQKVDVGDLPDDDLDQLEHDAGSDTAFSNNQNVVHLHSVRNKSKMILLEPTSFEDAQQIANHLKDHHPVIISLYHLDIEQISRVLDYLHGTVDAIGGDLKQIGEVLYLCTPEHIRIQGSINI